MTFQRARSEEQRDERRRVILDTATAMVNEMPVSEVSLNELSRRVGLAKSNVLRYFDSREAVLLELLRDFFVRWLAQVQDELRDGVDPGASLEVRARALARVLSGSLAAQRVLCELFGAQGGVLERNVSVEVATRHKRSSLQTLESMSELVREHVPEIGEDARMFCFLGLMMAGALSAYVPPPANLLAAYANDPDLAVLNLDMAEALETAFASALIGVLPRL